MNGWILLPPDEVPARWQERAIDVCLIPLLPDERASVLAEQPAQPVIADEDLPLARLVARGLAVKSIARHLDIDPRTAQRHISGLRDRLGAKSKAELASLLAAHGVS